MVFGYSSHVLYIYTFNSIHSMSQQTNIFFSFTGRKISFQAEVALMYDSVFVFAIGLQTLEQSHSLKISNVSCDREQPWDGGLSLINYINAVSHPYLQRCKAPRVAPQEGGIGSFPTDPKSRLCTRLEITTNCIFSVS